MLTISTKFTSFCKSEFSAQEQNVLSFLHWEHHLFNGFQLRATILLKTALSTGGQHGLSFSHWVQHVLAIFNKLHEFVQKRSFRPDQHVWSFSHRAHHFLAIFNKVHEFVKNSVFSPRLEHFVIFALGTLPFYQFSANCTIL